MGSGKSATATSIALGLQHVDVAYRYWWEGEKPHPVRVPQDSDGGARTAEELIDRGLTRWARFVDWCVSKQIVVVLDGLLFHISVTNLLKADATLGDVTSYIRRVAELTQPLRPRLVYFRQEDVAAALLRVAGQRGKDWLDKHVGYKCDTPLGRRLGLSGFPGLVHFSEVYCDWTDALFDGLEIEKLRIENAAGEWRQQPHTTSPGSLQVAIQEKPGHHGSGDWAWRGPATSGCIQPPISFPPCLWRRSTTGRDHLEARTDRNDRRFGLRISQHQFNQCATSPLSGDVSASQRARATPRSTPKRRAVS
jgi:hypothetical protein